MVKVSPSIQDIRLFKMSSSANISFQLEFCSNTTAILTTPITAPAVENALNSLPSVSSVGRVKILLEDTAESLRLAVIFVSSQSWLPHVRVTNRSGFNQINSTVIQTQTSSPSFRLGFGNRVTQPLTPNTTTTVMSQAILNLFTTTCQKSGGGRAFYTDTYDSPGKTRTGTLDNSVEPFCGHYSLKKLSGRRTWHIWTSTFKTVDSNGQETGSSGTLTVGATPSLQQYRYVSLGGVQHL